jgi:DNA polymerase III sliding clamp (beta) subunit (PCNA family)
MNITILVADLLAAHKFLTRYNFPTWQQPNYYLATVSETELTLAVTNREVWLETRVPAVIAPSAHDRFLIPVEALKAATLGDKKSYAHFAFNKITESLELILNVPFRGINSRSVFKTDNASAYSQRPTVQGQNIVVPKETFAALGIVAGWASNGLRHELNGVFFSPDDGGTLVATDGRQLVVAPAKFSGQSFILPNSAVRVLCHPDFATRDATIQQPDDAPNPHVEFRSGPHTFIARKIEHKYPNYRTVVPSEFLAEATISETHRAALVTWLWSIAGDRASVRLTWETPNHLTLTLQNSNSKEASTQVPVSVTGAPPVIAFKPRRLASLLKIGMVLRLVDANSPGLVVGPDGIVGLLMPVRAEVVDSQ